MSITSVSPDGGAHLRRISFRVCTAILLSLCLYPVSARGSDEALPKAEQILEKSIEATGGRAAYEKLHNRITRGTFSVAGMTSKAKMTSYSAEPQKQYVLIESDTLGKIETGIDGKTAWKITTMMGPQVIEGEERALMMRDSRFNALLYWEKLYKSAECVAVEEIDGKPCYKVVMTPNEGSAQTVYFDQKTYLMVKSEFSVETAMGKLSIVLTPSDYKRVDGILIAHEVVQNIVGI